MNELDLIKLNIYESYDNGEITYDEKEYLLEQIDYMYEDAYSRKMNRLSREINKDEKLINNRDSILKHYDIRERLIKQMKDRGLDTRYSRNEGKGKVSTYIYEPGVLGTDNDFVYFKGDGPILPEDKENYDSFVANRKKLQQTNDKLANKVPGSILAMQNANKQHNNIHNNENNTSTTSKGLSKGAKIGIGAGVVGGGLALGAGAVALKKRYDDSVDDLLKTKSELETQLKNTSDPKKKLAIMKKIKAIDVKVKQLEKASDKQLKRAVKEYSTFDLLLESIDDLYYDEY